MECFLWIYFLITCAIWYMTDGSRIMDWGAINQAAKLPSSVLHPKGDSSAYGTKFTQPKSFPLVTSSIHDKHDQMFFADYDLIETVHNTSAFELDGPGLGFSAIQKKDCGEECVRGLSGLCLCPPVTTSTPLKSDTDSVTATTSSQPPTEQAFSMSAHSHRTNQNSPLATVHHPGKLPDPSSLGQDPLRRFKRIRRVKRDDEDEEEKQKLCKCRTCTKLFKRTLYCRVFPCYQKKCKNGEWRGAPH